MKRALNIIVLTYSICRLHTAGVRGPHPDP
jgi:hypothetical protein